MQYFDSFVVKCDKRTWTGRCSSRVLESVLLTSLSFSHFFFSLRDLSEKKKAKCLKELKHGQNTQKENLRDAESAGGNRETQ